MKLHKIRNVPLENCAAEQKIAYNIAFSYHNLCKSFPSYEEAAKTFTEWFGRDYGERSYNLEAIELALKNGLKKFTEGKHRVLSSYEEIADAFPLNNVNYYDFREMTEKLFLEKELTGEQMNDATEKIAKYLREGGEIAEKITDSLGIYVSELEKDGKVWYRRFCYRLTGKELTPKEIMLIGLFLPHGANYGAYGIEKN